jgi:hypothetical protein
MRDQENEVYTAMKQAIQSNLAKYKDRERRVILSIHLRSPRIQLLNCLSLHTKIHGTIPASESFLGEETCHWDDQTRSSYVEKKLHEQGKLWTQNK